MFAGRKDRTVRQEVRESGCDINVDEYARIGFKEDEI
jgi:hypothetical protein